MSSFLYSIYGLISYGFSVLFFGKEKTINVISDIISEEIVSFVSEITLPNASELEEGDDIGVAMSFGIFYLSVILSEDMRYLSEARVEACKKGISKSKRKVNWICKTRGVYVDWENIDLLWRTYEG